jgi:type VI secretion system protein ImpL
MVVYWVTGGILLVYLVLVWFLATWLRLSGSDVWILRGGLALIGLLGAASFLWFHRNAKARQPKGEPEGSAGSETNDLDLLVHEAVRRLKTSTLGRGASLGNLPLIFLVGESGSTKTTTVIHSALDPELLAGHVYQDNNVVATRVANIWYSRAAIFVDPAGALLTQPNRWKRLVKLVQPGRVSTAVGKGQQSPRAAIVCFECESFMKPGASEATLSTARKLGTRLQEISQTLGISFPVYVLFTKLNRMSFFLDFVRGLSREEVSQVLGTTLPVRSLATGIYSEEETKRLTKAFDELFYSLAEKRLDLLMGENENDKLPGIYEFPRELRKLRTFLVQFLVELARPSQLSTNPFLRGFYFSGVRPVMVDDVVAAAPEEQPSESPQGGGATVMFSQVPRHGPAAVRASSGSRKVPQWVFLSQLFNDVIAKDRVALAASGFSSRVSLFRRILLITVASISLICAVGFLVSFFGNRALENDVRSAVGELQTVGSSSIQPASFGDLQKLDRLRQELATLSGYEKNGVPFRLRWGLYVGDRILPDARRLYFDRFQQLLLADTQARLVSDLRALPAQPGPTDDYKTTYEKLKAYLITTSNHEKSTAEFLAPVLMQVWQRGRNLENDRLGLANLQFNYFGAELASDGFFSKSNDQGAIDRARKYLALFSGIERYYLPLLGKASQSNPGISFNEKFPESIGVVTTTHRVNGAFTLGGFKFIDDAIRNPSGAIGGEEWVLGKATASELDQGTIQQKLRERYYADFVKEWRAVLENSSVNPYPKPYSDFPDADQKLEKLTSPSSPLLELMWFVSSNTNVSAPSAKDPFASVQAVEPPGDPLKRPDQVKLPENAAYMQALSDLGAKIDAIVHSPNQTDPALLTPVIQSASAAKVAANQATGSKVDNTYHTENLVHHLLEEPITNAEALISGRPKEALNGAGKNLCDQFNRLSGRFPFNPKAKVTQEIALDEFNGFFAPKTGALWAFYDNNKMSQFLVKQGTRYQSTSSDTVKITQGFLDSFNRMAAVTDAFYASGGPSPSFSYALTVQQSNVEGLILTIGNEALTQIGQQKRFTWTGAPDEIRVTAGKQTLRTYSGPWAAMRFVQTGSEVSNSHTNLRWNLMQSDGTPIMINGQQEYYAYQLQAGTPNPFDIVSTAGIRCEPQVAH